MKPNIFSSNNSNYEQIINPGEERARVIIAAVENVSQILGL